MENLKHISIVLLEPSHPGNIGAVARSMKTMGLSRLVMVRPKKFPHSEASKRAASAGDVLENAQVVDDIQLAIKDCSLVLGTSVRDREVTWPTLSPRKAAKKMIAQAHFVTEFEQETPVPQVAILFGRESSGLTNEEMDLCHSQIRIPANTQYSSLNLASAVQIIAYELRVRALKLANQTAQDDVMKEELNGSQQRQLSSTVTQQQGHLTHLQETLLQLDFVKSNPPTTLMRKLTRLYNKAELSVEEIQILRGMLTAIQAKIKSD